MSTAVIRVGELEIDILHRRVRVDRHDLHLTPLELSLLYLLATNAGRVLTRETLIDRSASGHHALRIHRLVGRNEMIVGRLQREQEPDDRVEVEWPSDLSEKASQLFR